MLSLVIFSVPLYKLFCDITGFQGFNKEVQIQEQDQNMNSGQLDIKVIFSAQVNDGLDWMFEAPQKMNITEGVKYDVVFKAKNNTGIESTGTSIFNILPPKIGPYLFKIECFCFEQQKIMPGEVLKLPVYFSIDPNIPNDIKTLTLSYTFYKIDNVANKKKINKIN